MSSKAGLICWLRLATSPKCVQAFDAELAKLPGSQQAQVRQFVANWRERPTPLTLKVGMGAAYRLAGLPVPASK
jgi:hypothetical protein